MAPGRGPFGSCGVAAPHVVQVGGQNVIPDALQAIVRGQVTEDADTQQQVAEIEPAWPENATHAQAVVKIAIDGLIRRHDQQEQQRGDAYPANDSQDAVADRQQIAEHIPLLQLGENTAARERQQSSR